MRLLDADEHAVVADDLRQLRESNGVLDPVFDVDAAVGAQLVHLQMLWNSSLLNAGYY